MRFNNILINIWKLLHGGEEAPRKTNTSTRNTATVTPAVQTAQQQPTFTNVAPVVSERKHVNQKMKKVDSSQGKRLRWSEVKVQTSRNPPAKYKHLKERPRVSSFVSVQLSRLLSGCSDKTLKNKFKKSEPGAMTK